MSEQSNIAWTNSTWNPWIGCEKVGIGCENCYAEALARRMTQLGVNWGGSRRRSNDATFYAPLRWQKKPWVCGCGQAFAEPTPHALGWAGCPDQKYHRRRVFLGSLMDWLDDGVPYEWLSDVLDVIRLCPDLRFIAVTKRPQLFAERIVAALKWERNSPTPRYGTAEKMRLWLNGNPPPNVIVMASVEDQQSADKRIPALLKIPAVCRGLSIEPLLGPVAVSEWLSDMCCTGERPVFDCDGNEIGMGSCPCQGQPVPRVDWVIIGGESGPKARPCNVAWIRSIVRQCREAGVPCFVKQVGSHPLYTDWTGFEYGGPGIRTILTHPKGGDPSEWPEDLRVREFPEVLR